MDYFDDLKALLKRKSGSPFAFWEATMDPSPHNESYDVRYVCLDFLGGIRKAMDDVHGLVERRMEEFKAVGRDDVAQFNELCFCILTANYTAEGGARIQKEIGDGFSKLPLPILSKKLKSLGYRFPNTRAGFIVENRRLQKDLRRSLVCYKSGVEAREWLVENVKGFGYKEASHFLRNTGFSDVAIIDRHILRFLVKEGLIEEPRSLTRRRYLSIERLLRGIANELGISLSELDLYLWYKMKGKVLK
jgi:N-glycosylase/DNA lyase